MQLHIALPKGKLTVLSSMVAEFEANGARMILRWPGKGEGGKSDGVESPPRAAARIPGDHGYSIDGISFLRSDPS